MTKVQPTMTPEELAAWELELEQAVKTTAAVVRGPLPVIQREVADVLLAGPQRIQQVEAKLMLTRASVRNALDGLFSKGLVERHLVLNHAAPHRGGMGWSYHRWHLTPAGRRALADNGTVPERQGLGLPDGHETMTALELETWLKEQERLCGRGESPAEPADPDGGPRDER